MDAATAAKLKTIFHDVLQADIDPAGDVALADLVEWDSVNHMHLIMDLEQEFGLRISDEQALALTSLADIRALLARAECEAA